MLLRFFTIPVCNGEEAAEDLNRFLGAHCVVAIDRQFVQDGENSVWALCVTYIQISNRPLTGRHGKIDYREVLSEAGGFRRVCQAVRPAQDACRRGRCAGLRAVQQRAVGRNGAASRSDGRTASA